MRCVDYSNSFIKIVSVRTYVLYIFFYYSAYVCVGNLSLNPTPIALVFLFHLFPTHVKYKQIYLLLQKYIQ